MAEGRPAPEHLDVVIIGAGLSGIDAAHHVRTSCGWAAYTVLEARGSLGGTWDLFRYPGIRSDSDMFTLGYPWRPWSGEESIAEGADILRYLEDTAAEEGIDRHIRFHHRVVRAEWSSAEGRWTLVVERGDPESGPPERVELTCTWLLSCTGYYRYDRGHLPDFDGLTDYRGTLVHPQEWPEDLDVDGRRVVVIGSGATAITLVPALADRGAQVTMLQRSPTYLVSLPRTNPVTRRIRRLLPRRWEAAALKWSNVATSSLFYELSRRRPGAVKRVLRAGVARELPPDFDVATHFSPHYDPWDQRLCVVTDGDLFRAIREGRVEVVTDHVGRFTGDGIELRSGRHLPADVVVTATGLDLLFLGGVELTVDGEKIDPSERLAYRGMMLEGVPNLSMLVGYTNASWTLKADLAAGFTARLLNELRAVGARAVTPEVDGTAGESRPLLGLTSGYVQRSADRFPRQGARGPWRMLQSYVADRRLFGRPGFDEALVFSGPAGPSASVPASVPVSAPVAGERRR